MSIMRKYIKIILLHNKSHQNIVAKDFFVTLHESVDYLHSLADVGWVWLVFFMQLCGQSAGRQLTA